MVYGQQAYQGFASAIGAKLGLRVQIAAGASPCIDASGTIYLPAMGTYQTAQEFTITCAAIVHELAHQFYGSHGQIDPKRSRLEHDCLNAVLDVADESCIAYYFATLGNQRPGELLDLSNSQSVGNNALHDWSNDASHAWKVLCTGILDARLTKHRYLNRIKRFNAHHATVRGVDARKCWRVLSSAKRAKSDNGAPNAKRFPRLIKLAKQLADLLQPFAPPDGNPPAPSPLEGALSAGKASPCGAREASTVDGAAIADGQGAVGAGAGSTGDGDGTPVRASHDTFALLYPAVERIGQRIATDGDGIALEDSLASGPVLGQAYRLATDGQCLARWQVNDHADGVSVAVVLDCSGSMHRRLDQCAGIARAFATGMRQCGEVLCLTFGTDCQQSADFARVRTMGGTNTHAALAKARKWLADRQGARWIVLITDGQPNDQTAVMAECAAAQVDRVRMLAIGLDCTVSMPVTVVTASDPAHLAIELQAAASLIERS
jgi:hypothetical protein